MQPTAHHTPRVPEPVLSFRDVRFSYRGASEFRLSPLSFDVHAGERICLIGGNGSGKSTLLRLANGLIEPTEGTVTVVGFTTDDSQHLAEIRCACGMVFQNPDEQIVASVVEDDVAFGPANLGLPLDELRARVAVALGAVGLEEYAEVGTHELSGGQKQRLALAGVLALEPSIILLDEATSMLDAAGRDSVRLILDQIAEQGIASITATHSMEEAARADRVLVLHHGTLVADGAPEDILPQIAELTNGHLELQPPTRYLIRKPNDSEEGDTAPFAALSAAETAHGNPAVVFRDVSVSYAPTARGAKKALDDISFVLQQGTTTGIAGPTGSGKSTLALLAAGLLEPDTGRITVLRQGIQAIKQEALGKRFRRGRRNESTSVDTCPVGILLQCPERQLFATTVADDIAFGPRNLGIAEADVQQRVQDALALVGLPPQIADQNPYALSGGQRRLAAIAGVLAMRPEVLILDEPAAGLDSRAHRQLLDILAQLKAQDTTIIMITHHLEDIAALCDIMLVLEEGALVSQGSPTRWLQRVPTKASERTDQANC